MRRLSRTDRQSEAFLRKPIRGRPPDRACLQRAPGTAAHKRNFRIRFPRLALEAMGLPVGPDTRGLASHALDDLQPIEARSDPKV